MVTERSCPPLRLWKVIVPSNTAKKIVFNAAIRDPSQSHPKMLLLDSRTCVRALVFEFSSSSRGFTEAQNYCGLTFE